MATLKLTKKMENQALSELDWDKIDAQTDEDILQQITSNPDTAPITIETKEDAAQLIKATRERFKISQAVFAKRFHLPVKTVRDWEQARKKPDQAAINYLRIIKKNPEAVIDALNSRE